MSIRDIAALHNLSIGTVQRHLAGHYRADRIPAPQAGTKGTTGQARAFDAPRTGAPPGVPASARAEPPAMDKLKQLLHKEPMSVFGLATAMACSTDEVELLLADSIRVGLNINPRNGLYYLDATPMHGALRENDLAFTTDNKGVFEFAISTDQHLCSKYERLDCLNDFYDQVEQRGITVVLNAGNWIDGEATFNRHEIHTHGMDNQLQYLAKQYPQRQGVMTYAVAGADHEGWYSRREGVDIGKYAENVMRQNGREDWIDLGYVERAVPLNHASSGAGSNILVMHPGGGSAYATSYAPQKIVEAFSAGEKPAALVLGHYHKADYTYIRDVHAMQGGCFQSQSLFMRSKRLSAHLGGCFVKLTVDPRTGAFVECSYTFRNYFDKSYYNGRWSQSSPVTQSKLVPR